MPWSVEDRLTMSCVNYFRVKYSDHIIYHVANERQTSKARGEKLKKMGVLAGVADLHIPVPRGGYTGLVIELKYDIWNKGKRKKMSWPSQSQLEFLAKMNQYGRAVAVCWNIDDFMQTVDAYMGGDPVECEYLVDNGHIEIQ